MKKRYILVPLAFASLFGLVGCSFMPGLNGFAGRNKSAISPSDIDSDPIIDEAEGTVTYGTYPQSRVLDDNLIDNLNKIKAPTINDWYYYNGDYYAKLVGQYTDTTDSEMSWSKKFANGEVLEPGQLYWFKCEPVIWEIQKTDGDTYTLLSRYLLNTHIYDDDDNNYEESEIRAWLNGEFFETLFSFSDARYVLETSVDNSASQTDRESADLACDDTYDKVYIPSYKDVGGDSYVSGTMTADITDYAFATGAYKDPSSENASYWLRSPSKNNYSGRTKAAAHFMYYSGYLDKWDVDATDVAIRPMINIKY